MDYHIVLALLSALFCFASCVPYARDIFYGTTRPNAVTWFLWLFIQGLAIAAQFQEGASLSVVIVIADALTIGFVFILSIIGYGYRSYGTFDVLCGLLCISAIVLWQITGNANIALVFSVIADIFAISPTLRKTYLDPWSEFPFAWALTAVGAFFGVLSSTVFNFSNIVFPAYLFGINALMFLLAYFGRRAHLKPVSA